MLNMESSSTRLRTIEDELRAVFNLTRAVQLDHLWSGVSARLGDLILIRD